jgi:hypothetical protein
MTRGGAHRRHPKSRSALREKDGPAFDWICQMNVGFIDIGNIDDGTVNVRHGRKTARCAG